MHGAARRPRVRRQGHRRTLFVVDAGVDTGADRRPGAPCRCRRRRRRDACTSASRSSSAACSSTYVGRMARDGWTVTGQKGHHPVSERTPTIATSPPRPGQRLRQDRAGGARARPARGRGRARVHRVDGRADRRRRRPGHRGRGAHRLPRVPRRPGQDPAPAACTRASSPTAATPTTWPQLAELGHRAVRPGRVATSTRSRETVRVGRRAGRVRRADRHRRPVDGPRRRQEPRQRRRRRRPGRVRRRC